MSEILYNTSFLQLKSTESKSGKPWFYAHRPNASNVVVLLVRTLDEVLFLIEERPPIQAENKGKYCIGLCAGLVGDVRLGESIEDAVRTELMEEAGLVAENITIKTLQVASSAGCVSETFAIALVDVGHKIPVNAPVNDDGVIVDRVWIPKDKVHSWLKEKEGEGYVLTAQTLAALFYMYE